MQKRLCDLCDAEILNEYITIGSVLEQIAPTDVCYSCMRRGIHIYKYDSTVNGVKYPYSIELVESDYYD